MTLKAESPKSTTTTATTVSETTTTTTTTTEEEEVVPSMDDIVGLCKRRGFLFPSSEIYNGYAGFYDYGPLGVELKNNIKQRWWQTFVTQREDVVGLDSTIIHHPNTWKSSGHVEGFSDPMVDCKETKLRFRADQLFYAPVIVLPQEEGQEQEQIGYICIQEASEEDMKKEAKKQAKSLLKSLKRSKSTPIDENFQFQEVASITDAEFMKQIPSPALLQQRGQYKLDTLTLPRDFNLMFGTQVGPTSSSENQAYLRPETAQGIFINFKNVLGTSRQSIPFGIAQIGKAFRNEISPRNFLFRSREFEQMEVEYFIPPGDDVWPSYLEEWKREAMDFLVSVGVRSDWMDWDVHEGDKLAHYARACTDIVFDFPFGRQELMGIAARGNYDLTQHSEGSGKTLDFFHPETKERYIPHVIEPSLGVDRLVLAILCSAYAKDVVSGEERSFLKFHPSVAPIKAAVLPLVKNKPELVETARSLYKDLSRRFNVQWDASGAIGRRYRRADEVGIPFCITIDFDTLEQEGTTVTVRDRDSTKQIRMPITEVMAYLGQEIDGY